MFIADFVTRRIKSQMQELTLQQAIDLCQVPDSFNEQGISRALQFIVKETNLPLDKWTVQERIVALFHYITAQEKGDWQLVDNGSVADYLIEQDYPETPYIFQDDGDLFHIVPLTGEYVEAIERATDSTRGKWILAAMAATIRAENDDFDGIPDERISENMTRLLALPESVFNRFLAHFQAAQIHLAHCVNIDFHDDGIILLPKGDTGLPPVRFQFDEVLEQPTITLWRKPDEFSANNLLTTQI